MERLNGYLAKYRVLEPPQASMARLVCQVVLDECGIALREKDVRISGGGAHLSCHPVVRSELMQCAPRVLAALRDEHGVRLAFVR